MKLSVMLPELNSVQLKMLEKVILEIIGEDQKMGSYTHRGFMDLTETSLNEATNNVKIGANNNLRAEQRNKLKELL